MRKLLIPVLVIAVAIAVFFAYPLVNEGTKSSCKALERRALTLVSMESGPEGLIIAALGRQLLRQGLQLGQRQAQALEQGGKAGQRRERDFPVLSQVHHVHARLGVGDLAR